MVNPSRQNHAHRKQGRSHKHHRIRTNRFEKPTSDAGSYNGSQRAADAYNREQPFTLFFRVDVVGKCPELRDQHEIEQADPQEESDAELKLHSAQHIKNGEIRDEKCDHSIDKPNTISSARVSTIEWNDQQKEQRLARSCIALDLSTGATKNQSLAYRFDDVIRCKEKKHIQREEQCR